MRDFMAEESPCFALGLVEERKQTCGVVALRPAEVIPPEISGLGFNFGHALLGTTEFEVIQFVFHFYGFETYNMLVNPNNRLVKKVLMRMVESGDYFFFAISPNQSVTAFRSEIGQKNVAGLSTNLRQIQGSTTTDGQYQRALAQFRRRPDPPGQVLNWVCRDNLSYLDLTQNRLENGSGLMRSPTSPAMQSVYVLRSPQLVLRTLELLAAGLRKSPEECPRRWPLNYLDTDIPLWMACLNHEIQRQ
jgi:hypothetical protein